MGVRTELSVYSILSQRTVRIKKNNERNLMRIFHLQVVCLDVHI